MGKYSDYLIVSDFDHTLTGPDGSVPESNKRAIEHFMAEGGIFSVASGRSLPLFRSKRNLYPGNGATVLFNGALCYDFRQEKTVLSYQLPETFRTYVQTVRQRCPQMNIELQRIRDHVVLSGEQSRLDMCRELRVTLNFTPCQQIHEIPHMIVMIAPGFVRPDDPARSIDACGEKDYNDLTELEQWTRTQSGYDAIRSTGQLLEIVPAGCSKGVAARELANLYGGRELICVGDAKNDESMLLEADRGYLTADGDQRLHTGKIQLCAACGEGAIASVINML